MAKSKLLLRCLIVVCVIAITLHCLNLIYSMQSAPPISIFTSASWDNLELEARIKAENLCVPVNRDPPYTMCVLDPLEDEFISKSFIDGGVFEPELSIKLQYAASLYQKENIVFFDGGAQLGTHSLAMASKGYQVWSVEPQIQNAARIHLSATKSNFLHRVTIVNNALSEISGLTRYIWINPTNNGGSRLHNSSPEDSYVSYQPVQTILLKDVLKLAAASSKNVLIMKLDLEMYECRVLLSSKEIFDWDIFIPYIFMEWNYNIREISKEAFTKGELDTMVRLLVSKSYIPYDMLTWEALSPHAWNTWTSIDIVWVHILAKKPF